MIGGKIIGVLNDYGLLNDDSISKKIKTLSWKEINQINEAINSSSISIEDASNSINKNEFNLLINRNLNRSPNLNKLIKKSLLYSDKLFLYNELGILLEIAPNGYDLEYIKSQLTERVKELIKLRPLLEHGLLSLVNPDDFFKKFNAVIKELTEKDLQNEELGSLLKNNTILGVPDNDSEKFYIGAGDRFILGAQHVIQKGETGFKINFTVPKKVITKSLSSIDNDDSKKRVLRDLYSFILNDTNSDLLLCDYLHSNYLTSEMLQWDIIHKKRGLKEKESMYPAIISLDLKFLDNLTYENIIKTRRKVGGSFEDFRIKLNEYIKNIKALPFTQDFPNQVNEIKQNFIEPEIRKLDRTFNSMISSRLIKMSSIAIGTLLASILTNSYASLVSGEVLLAHQGAEVKKDMLQLKNNPMYFLWKLKHN